MEVHLISSYCQMRVYGFISGFLACKVRVTQTLLLITHLRVVTSYLSFELSKNSSNAFTILYLLYTGVEEIICNCWHTFILSWVNVLKTRLGWSGEV